jgi:hypothetical protein
MHVFLAAEFPPGCRDAGFFWLTNGSPLSHDSVVIANRLAGVDDVLSTELFRSVDTLR